MTRRPWHRGKGWSPEETAGELHGRREALVAGLRKRPTAQGVPLAAQEEIVNDAMTAVVMASRPVLNEQHLLGAFWTAADFRLRRYHEGRHLTQIGRRQRVELDERAEGACAVGGVDEQVVLVDRMRRAADWLAELDERERRVVSVMASYDVGPLPAARMLSLPFGEVRSASRSARAKLDQVAVISAAGRMCGYRYGAIAADAEGRASEHEARAARAHVEACTSCRVVYRQLRREMGPDWQRRVAAALVPAPVVSTGHMGWLGKMSAWLDQRPGLPRGTGERVAEVAGGAGIVKAAVAGTALIAAGGALTGGFIHSIGSGGTHSHHHARVHVVHRASTSIVSASFGAKTTTAISRAPTPSTRPTKRRAATPRPPSKSLDYLAVGGPASGSRGRSSSEPYARAASASGDTSTAGSSTPSRAATSSHGGGTTLKYLGQ